MISLTTQCPHCETQFDVQAHELQRRKGLVRCVQCAHIFDGYEAIVEGQSAPVLPLEEQPTEPTKPVAPVTGTAEFFIPQEPVAFKPEPDPEPLIEDTSIAGLDEDPIHFDPDAFALDETEEPAVMASTDQERPYRLQVPATATPVYRERRITPVEGRSFWQSLRGLLMRLLLLSLVVLTLAQLAYVFRAQIALYAPFTRPALQSFCAHLGCEVPYLRDISAIDVIYSRLSLEDSSAAEAGGQSVYHYVLRLGLRNEAASAQEWPTLFVTFNDASANVMARLAIAPEQYLDAWQLQGPFLPGQSVDIQLDIDAHANKINGFKIEKFFS